jgi:phytoene dehydrogenase-like protein
MGRRLPGRDALSGVRSRYDAVVIGSGPNGLSAAIVLAQAGHSVLVLEGEDRIGGGARSEELTLPGLVHDPCATVHPLGAASPFFRSLPLARHGLEWQHPAALLAHPFDDGSAVLWKRSIPETGMTLDAGDGEALGGLIRPFLERWEELVPDVLAPLRWPSHPLLLARYGVRGIRSAWGLSRRRFGGDRARALFAGVAMHGALSPERISTGAFGLLLTTLGHAVGWPVARGGTQSIADALAGHLRELGGEIRTGSWVRSLQELPRSRTILLDLTPRQVLALAGDRLPAHYRRALRRYRYGSGTFKVDWALSGPIPWRAPECRQAATVHLAGSVHEMLASARRTESGEAPERPLVVLVQYAGTDPDRAPPGLHTVYAYCHVPNGSTVDMLPRIEAQLERFAPGFRDLVLARSVMSPGELERHNPNLVGGDISGGAPTLDQLFFRPMARPVPYATPVPGLYLCSASTPPGGGVHGMCGYHAARAALRWMERKG